MLVGLDAFGGGAFARHTGVLLGCGFVLFGFLLFELESLDFLPVPLSLLMQLHFRTFVKHCVTDAALDHLFVPPLLWLLLSLVSVCCFLFLASAVGLLVLLLLLLAGLLLSLLRLGSLASHLFWWFSFFLFFVLSLLLLLELFILIKLIWWTHGKHMQVEHMSCTVLMINQIQVCLKLLSALFAEAHLGVSSLSLMLVQLVQVVKALVANDARKCLQLLLGSRRLEW